MSLKINTKMCDQCGTCIAVCPHNALVLAGILSVDSDSCAQCGACVSICPVAALIIEK